MADNIFPQKNDGPVIDKEENTLYTGAEYTPVLSNWFTAKPYGFRFTSKKGTAKVMYLPIGPSNLTITTQFATNITPTLYGTVEEHSPVRYFDIMIEGTTGMAPKFTAPMSPNEIPVQQPGRSSFTVQASLTSGLFAKTISAAQNVFNDASAIFGKSAPGNTGIQLDQTGYIAFHNFYRFFLKYKKDASGTDKTGNVVDTTPRNPNAKHPLVFFNYKDNNEYNVVIRNFTLRRDKENPMLYFYSISLRGYELKEIENSSGVNQIKGQEELLAALGLNGIKGSSFLTKAKQIASNAKGVLGSVANGVNQLGR